VDYGGQNSEEMIRTSKRLTFLNPRLLTGSTTAQKKTGPLE